MEVRGDMRKLSKRLGAPILMLAAVLLSAHAPVQARRSTASIFTAVDTDKDGTVDRPEVRQAASALFDRVDTDKDGKISVPSLVAAPRAVVTPRVAQTLAERASCSAIAPIPPQKVSIVSIGRTTGEGVHARMLNFGGAYQATGSCWR